MLTFQPGWEVSIVKFTRTNERITAPQLRVIDSEGKQLGILSKAEALTLAKEKGLDLIEVAPQAQPPVARILDFQKYRYTESKKERVAKKNASEVELKEIWLSPRIAEHDLLVRIRKAEEFLGKGFRVKFTVRFRGRELGHPENGHRVLNHIFAHFGARISLEREAKFEGRSLTTIVGINRGAGKEEDA